MSKNIPVSFPNQTLSQFDVFSDKPDLINILCEELTKTHRAHLGDDLSGLNPLAEKQDSAPIPTRNDAMSLTEIAAGLGALGFAKLHERKIRIE